MLQHYPTKTQTYKIVGVNLKKVMDNLKQFGA